MKYMLLIYSPEDAWSSDEWEQCVATSLDICQDMAAKGQLVSASPLHPVATGATVRVRNGNPILTAGPFAETTEQLGGYYLIDVRDLDEAIAIAARLPPAKIGTIEIRPLIELSGLPDEKVANEQKTSTSLGVDSLLKKYMFLCYDDEQWWQNAGEVAHRAAMRQAIELTQRLDAQGRYLSASPLHSSATATCVQVRNGQSILTDGPFAETREVLGGYYLILARDQDEALSFAAQHPGVAVGAVEVRPVFDVRSLFQ